MKIEPPYWFVGMQEPTVQILLTDEENHEYCFLDVDVSRFQEPCTINLYAMLDNRPVTFTYELKARRWGSRERKGFGPEDVIYLLMPDRFCNNKDYNEDDNYNKNKCKPSRRHGGTINGIRSKLDYLSNLGITAIWHTPVLANDMPETDTNDSYHGYAVTDFYAIDRHFGTIADYKALVEEAHRKGLKIIKDMIFNHCGAAHPWLNNPPELDWFNSREWIGDSDVSGGNLPEVNEDYLQTNYRLTPTIDPYASDYDRRQTIEGWFVKSMPDLNLRNTHLLKYLTQCSIWWIETADIDGIRMDTFPYTDRKAMKAWMDAIHNEYPDFKILGETWVTQPAFSARWQEYGVDSTMDFAMFEAFNYAKHEDSREWWSGLNRIYHVLCYDYLYPTPQMTLAFLDNHDVNRFIEEEPDSYNVNHRTGEMAIPIIYMRMRVALALLLTMPRIPQLYYGTEILMAGNTSITDGNVRKDYPWNKPLDKHQQEMLRFTTHLLRWRKTCPAIHHGTTRQFIPHNGIYVLARQYSSTTILTIANGSSRSATLELHRYREVIGDATTARNILTNRPFKLNRKSVNMKANELLLLEIKR